ncbi:MAG: hypothetical protein ACLSG9_02165 [Eubacterium sp.]
MHGTMDLPIFDQYDDDKDIFSKVAVEDLRDFGLIPEFIGRFPMSFLEGLDEDLFVKFLPSQECHFKTVSSCCMDGVIRF